MYQDHSTPILSVIISLLSSIIAFVSLAQVQVWTTLVAAFVAIISGGFAIRHFYYNTKKTKMDIKILEKNETDNNE